MRWCARRYYEAWGESAASAYRPANTHDGAYIFPMAKCTQDPHKGTVHGRPDCIGIGLRTKASRIGVARGKLILHTAPPTYPWSQAPSATTCSRSTRARPTCAPLFRRRRRRWMDWTVRRWNGLRSAFVPDRISTRVVVSFAPCCGAKHCVPAFRKHANAVQGVWCGAARPAKASGCMRYYRTLSFSPRVRKREAQGILREINPPYIARVSPENS
ncbi:hypothetical protein C8R45DRAFT_179815 [Mycena sanguinolenta]|nr:hypothetical protein C8R45DRAFT_179815 [Mycena sanguinolenta]